MNSIPMEIKYKPKFDILGTGPLNMTEIVLIILNNAAMRIGTQSNKGTSRF